VSDNEKPNYESARTTLALTPESASVNDPMQAAEARMRRALGLDGEQLRSRPAQERADSPQRPAERFSAPGHKRRFVHDGEVPVTLVHGLVSNRREHADGNGTRNGANAQPTNRLEVAEAALAAEIATRERIERAFQEAQASVHDLQTKLGHADLARQEAVETLRRERESAAGLRASIQELEDQVTAARQAQEAAERAWPICENAKRRCCPTNRPRKWWKNRRVRVGAESRVPRFWRQQRPWPPRPHPAKPGDRVQRNRPQRAKRSRFVGGSPRARRKSDRRPPLTSPGSRERYTRRLPPKRRAYFGQRFQMPFVFAGEAQN